MEAEGGDETIEVVAPTNQVVVEEEVAAAMSALVEHI